MKCNNNGPAFIFNVTEFSISLFIKPIVLTFTYNSPVTYDDKLPFIDYSYFMYRSRYVKTFSVVGNGMNIYALSCYVCFSIDSV